MKWLLTAIAVCASFVGGVATVHVLDQPVRPDEPKPEIELVEQGEPNPGTFYIDRMAGGLAAACDVIIDKAEKGEFNDLGEIETEFAPMVQEVRKFALVEFKDQIFDELNGEGFTNEKAVELFTKLRDGYLEAVK